MYGPVFLPSKIFPQRKYVCDNLEGTISEAIIPGIYNTYEDGKS